MTKVNHCRTCDGRKMCKVLFQFGRQVSRIFEFDPQLTFTPHPTPIIDRSLSMLTRVPPLCDSKGIGPKHDEFLLNRPIAPYADEDIVGGLDSHAWDFNNATTARCCPKRGSSAFPSTSVPLPGGKFLAKIRLPEEFSAHRRYSSVQIKVDYTAASDAIKQGVEKLDPPHNRERKDFILKVVDQEAYMYGKCKIIDYEAVRNEDDVEFVLIKRKDFQARVAAEKVKQAAFVEHFKTAYPPSITEHTDELLRHEELASSGKIEAFSTSPHARRSKSKGNAQNHQPLVHAAPRDFAVRLRVVL